MYVGLTFYSGLPYGGINWALKYAPDSILNVSGRAVGQTRALRQADPILRLPGALGVLKGPLLQCFNKTQSNRIPLSEGKTLLPHGTGALNLIQLNKADGGSPPGRVS